MTERIAASFRDPAGFVFRRDGVLYRQVNDVHRASYEAMMRSGLYEALVDRGLLIPHRESDVAPAEPATGSLVIRPAAVPFISYPFEWSPGQLRAAGEVTLEVQRLSVEHGMTLRDASAYNVQFVDCRPTLIDTLSFEPLVEDRPWVAYAQYCRHFLAPLALMVHVDVRLGGLLRTELDGVSLDLASTLLPRRTRYRPGLGLHIHAHARSQRRHADSGEGAHDSGRPVSRRALLGLVDSLATATHKLEWRAASSTWRDYYEAGESYSSASARHKAELVAELLRPCRAETVWDLGANTGQFSRIAADVTGAHVVAMEMDPSAVEVNWQRCRQDELEHVLPLLVNFTNPTPAQGWAHRERDSLEERGPADVVLALALIHHLSIGNNVPLPSLLEWLGTLTRTAIVEWIPKEDPMVARLLSSREDVFPDYHVDGFEQAARQHFDIVRQEPVDDSLRVLYRLERS